ncbi:MAG: formate--tetrahydrofolate ligase [Armatimonadota bacterium]|nr:formate--tetrahydrofolate ligase [Armatimonadota bacterium]MDR7426605.1 formate--tetrahydrofolate ligase [Armatimonadota bacterium]MDR7468625.1 formate--tetrahydrofolate ligase [Armatimonadota bacterium]MDR7473748.1 formate--tetrahydrofolate ligase [Armatimonadota bacterium]MDR7538131.1 formate--tetrahydrofolate ligase [Armatimonadota bacterium]
MKSDLEIAQEAILLPVVEVARRLGLSEDDLDLYGKYKAKIHLDVLDRLADRPNGKYVTVTAITPTPLGEGKTTTAIGLGMALNRLGRKTINTLRQPSMGPTFGIKGGAAGGGYSQAVPMEDFNLHFTGDIHAVAAAHNLLAAMLDAHIMHGNELRIDPYTITWPRVVDISDRALRNIIIGLGTKEDGRPRQAGFDIAVASEVMAILALAKDLRDLRQRLGRIVVAFTEDGEPVTAEDLKAAGAMAVLLKDALMPNLIQTLENTPVIVHAGPFANIAHGNNSIVADAIALKLADFVVTESGFGADCGAEKMINIKCRYSGLKLNAAVIVATIRALKMHGGVGRVIPGRPLPPELVSENVEAVRRGCENLAKHVENMRLHGLPVVVAINLFPSDTDREVEVVREAALAAGAMDAVTTDNHARGSLGALELARAVIRAAESGAEMRFLYPLEASIKEKIETIATQVYGADGVDYEPLAEQKIRLYTRLGYDRLPINMAKTHLSLSHDPNLKGRPRNFRLPIRDIRASVGAGFLYPLCGEMRTMPGLPKVPAATKVDLDLETRRVVGLF